MLKRVFPAACAFIVGAVAFTAVPVLRDTRTEATYCSLGTSRGLTIVPAAYAETENCVEKEEVACSNPWIVRGLTNIPGAYYEDKFGSACVVHDYCYRHGYKTYGQSRTYCDDSFYRTIKRTCDDIDAATYISLGLTNAGCYAAAEAYYKAVQNFGEPQYHRSDGTYCRYDKDHENAHIHKVNADGSIGKRVNAYMWTSGWRQFRVTRSATSSSSSF